MADEWDWGGTPKGQTSLPKPPEHQGFFGTIRHDVASVGKAIGGGVVRGANDVASIFRGFPTLVTQSIPNLGKSVWHDFQHEYSWKGLNTMPGVPAAKSGPFKGYSDQERKAYQGRKDRAVGITSDMGFMQAMRQEVAHDPQASVIPGLHTAVGLTSPEGRKDLGKHPLFTALDVLPYANGGAKLVTSGTELAAGESARLEGLGRVGKAAEIGEKGMGVRDLAKAMEARAEQALTTRYPHLKMNKMLPSQLSEKLMFGGSKVRHELGILNASKSRFRQLVHEGEMEELAKQIAKEPAGATVGLGNKIKNMWAKEALKPLSKAAGIRIRTAAAVTVAKDATRLLHDSGGLHTSSEVEALQKAWEEGAARFGKKVPKRAVLNDMKVWDPRMMFPRGTRVPFGMKQELIDMVGGGDQLYISKNLARNLEDSFRKMDMESGLLRGSETVTRTMRQFVLYAHPFYYFHVALSGIVMEMSRGSIADFQYVVDAIKERLPGPEAELTPHQLGLGKDWLDTDSVAFHDGFNLADKIVKEHGLVGKPIEAYRLINGMVHKISGSMQNFSKSLSYISEYERLAESGAFTAEQAKDLALEHANKALVDVNSLTAYERGIFRAVFPFYTWSKHILRSAFTYPFDHPVRAAVISQISQHALEDYQQQYKGLPEKYMSYAWTGSGDNRTLFPLSGAIPWTQIPTMMTWQGLVSRTNPILQAILEQLGVNTITGGPELYGKTKFDPITGQKKFVPPSFWAHVVSQVMPQLNQILADTDLQAYYAANPEKKGEAATRALVGFSPIHMSISAAEKKAAKNLLSQLKADQREARKLAKLGITPAPAGTKTGSEWDF